MPDQVTTIIIMCIYTKDESNLTNCCRAVALDIMFASMINRVGSHVVSVRIYCTEKWRTSFHTDV